jgi:hypothetical protein
LLAGDDETDDDDDFCGGVGGTGGGALPAVFGDDTDDADDDADGGGDDGTGGTGGTGAAFVLNRPTFIAGFDGVDDDDGGDTRIDKARAGGGARRAAGGGAFGRGVTGANASERDTSDDLDARWSMKDLRPRGLVAGRARPATVCRGAGRAGSLLPPPPPPTSGTLMATAPSGSGKHVQRANFCSQCMHAAAWRQSNSVDTFLSPFVSTMPNFLPCDPSIRRSAVTVPKGCMVNGASWRVCFELCTSRRCSRTSSTTKRRCHILGTAVSSSTRSDPSS